MNVKAAEKICEVVGKIIPSTDPTETEEGNFIRIRVEMDVSLPLCRDRVVSWRKEKNPKSLSNTNVYPIYAIGTAKWIIRTVIVRFG